MKKQDTEVSIKHQLNYGEKIHTCLEKRVKGNMPIYIIGSYSWTEIMRYFIVSFFLYSSCIFLGANYYPIFY